MSEANRRKAEFLGMPYGTAANRLRKKIMLDLLRQLGHDQCFRCGLRIDTVKELSVEHKEPWLGRSEELFWSLDNIAFSHNSCNSAAGNKVGGCGHGPIKYFPPKGMKRCSLGDHFAPVDTFWKGQWSCKDCQRNNPTKVPQHQRGKEEAD